MYFIAISKLDLGIAVTLNKMSPFFVMVFAVVFLNEAFTKNKLISLLIAVVGVLIIMRPSTNFNILYGLIGLLSAIVAGGAYTVIRKLRDYDHPLVIIFYFCLYSVIISFPIAQYTGIHIDAIMDLGILALIGIFAVIAQTCMTFAYRYAPASELAIYSYMNIVFSSIIGFVLFKEHIMPLNLLGISLIIFAGYVNYRGQTKESL